jgi:hypothetical protein
VRLLLATAGLLALAGSAAAATGPSLVHTVRRSAGYPIHALAQDGRLIAWLASGGARCNGVHVEGNGTVRTVPQPPSTSMTCHWDLTDEQQQLAIAARASAVLWTLHEGGDSPFDYVLTGQIGGPEQRIDRLAHTSDGTGLWLGGIAGSGKTLAYSVVDVEYVDELSCLAGDSCKRRISGGGINLVSGGQATPLPGAGPALDLATAAGRIAYVQASKFRKGAPTANGAAPIEVVTAADGTTVAEVPPQGVPLAIALAPHVLAVLTQHGNRDRLSWYDPSDGAQLGSISISRQVAPAVATSDHTVVYRVGRTLRGVAVSSGRTRTLARISGVPAGLSLEHGRLAWAENRHGTGRVRTIAVS